MVDDKLSYHIANLGLIIIGVLSVYKIVGPALLFILILPGVIFGFLFSWQYKDRRPQNIDLFIGMLSLASVVITLSRLYEVEINFNNLLNIFSAALVWLALFQSFGVRPNEGGYVLIQFISISLFVSSIALALEQESLYLIYLAIYLFLLIFSLRINLVAEKRRKGSIIVGEKEIGMGITSQLRLSVIIFSVLILITSLLFPFVPRFENLSLRWVPSDLLGLPEQVPLLKLISDARFRIKENKTLKKEQLADDRLKKRETGGNIFPPEFKEEKKEVFPYNKEELSRQIESLNISPSSVEAPLNKNIQLRAEVKLKDGTAINVTNLVEWESQGSKVLEIEQDGNIRPISEGSSIVSARFQDTFSNNVFVTIIPPQFPPKKTSFIFYILLFLWWILLTASVYLYIKLMIRRGKLKKLAFESPRFFIRELYFSICKILKVIGYPRARHIAPREFVEILKEGQTEGIVPLHKMTERFLEAVFSNHDITKEDSSQALKAFHDTAKGFLIQARFLRKFVGKILMLEVPVMSTYFTNT